MNQIIAITVKGKIAQTEFDEVVSLNSVYTLKFTFDEEWEEFPKRVAVVMWEGGVAERLFEGDECEMPRIRSMRTEHALVGVYSVAKCRRIASSFVRLRCRAGACCAPDLKPVDSLHEQILDFLNGKDWSIFEEKVAAGVYSAVRVNAFGLVTEGWDLIEVGAEGQSMPSEKLADGGVFFRLQDGLYTPCHYQGGKLLPLSMAASAGFGGKALHVGEKSYDGSEEVTVTADDLGLARVATSGSYQDLLDAPLLDGAVTSVNGQTGDVVISKNDLGLARVAITNDYNDLDNRPSFEDGGVTSVNGQTGDVVISKNDLDLARVAITGSYEDLKDKPTLDGAVTSVNGQTGAVVISKNDLDLARVALTNRYSDLDGRPDLSGFVTSVNGQSGAVVISKNDLDLARVALTNDYNDLINKPSFKNAVTSVNGQTGEVVISKNDLGLARVAITGSYNDLTDLPEAGGGAVSSVNGQTGEVFLSKSDIGLGMVTNDRQIPFQQVVQRAKDFNEMTALGFFHVEGTTAGACKNCPMSTDNLAPTNCTWGLLVFPTPNQTCILQIAFSERSDNEIFTRTYYKEKWSNWRKV